MHQERRLVDLGFTAERFPLGTHMCYIFDNEREREEMVVRFFARGANDGEHLVYLADRISKEKLVARLADCGVDAEALDEAGRLFVRPADATYCPDQRFSASRMLDNLRRFHRDSVARGHHAMRLSGEMDWALKAAGRTEELIRYEARINDLVLEHPGTIICQYDARKFTGALLHQVLEVHPYMVVRNQVVRNPYYRELAPVD